MYRLTLPDFDNAPCGMLIFSEEGIIQDANLTFVSLLGYTLKADLIGHQVNMIFKIAGNIFFQTHFFPMVKMHGRADEIFFVLNGRERNGIPVICNAVKKEENGQTLYFCVFFSAIQRGKYEEELLQAKKQAENALLHNKELLAAKEQLEQQAVSLDHKLQQLKQMNYGLIQFGKIISHDLQEPIRKIALMADSVAYIEKENLQNETLSKLYKINNEGHKMRLLVATLEKFISLSIPSEDITSFNPGDLVRKVVSESQSSSENREIILNLGHLPGMKGYRSQVELLFFHIFQNSIIYSEKNKPLVLDVDGHIIQRNIYREVKERYKYDDVLRLTIKDDGPGFDAANAEIFSINRKVANGFTGLSFGLAFCKKIVDNHFGTISLTSTKKSGTSIVIELPLKMQTTHKQ